MRRFLSWLGVLSCCLLISSCSLLPFGNGVLSSNDQIANARMEEIAEALNSRNADALKQMFSPYALERATDLDAGLAYLLAFFPDGGVTWEREIVNVSGHTQYGKKSLVLLASYIVSANGEDYRLFFADFTRNDIYNPDNVGIYALGVTPKPTGGAPADVGFDYWSSGVNLTTDGEYSYAGVYVPQEGQIFPVDQAEARMGQIADAVERSDTNALREMFSGPAIAGAASFEQNLQLFLAAFPSGGLTWETLVVNEAGDGADKLPKVLTTQYRISAGEEEFWLFFADVVLDAKNPQNVGLASLAVAPWSEPGDPDADTAFGDWCAAWITTSNGETGIYVSKDATDP